MGLAAAAVVVRVAVRQAVQERLEERLELRRVVAFFEPDLAARYARFDRGVRRAFEGRKR